MASIGAASAEHEKWYVGDMDKKLCNQLVGNAESGNFLVRIGSTQDRFVVAINDQGEVGPYQVKITPEGGLLWREQVYLDIDAVVMSIRANPFKGMSGQMVQLGAPASGGGYHPSTVTRIQSSGGVAFQSAPQAPEAPQDDVDEPTRPKEDYVLYQTLFEYRNDDPDDLNFDAGEILQVTDEGEGEGSRWMEGRTQDLKEGSFPSTYVRKINIAAAAPKTVESYGA